MEHKSLKKSMKINFLWKSMLFFFNKQIWNYNTNKKVCDFLLIYNDNYKVSGILSILEIFTTANIHWNTWTWKDNIKKQTQKNVRVFANLPKNQKD